MNSLLMWFLLAFGQSQATTTPPPPPPPLETGSFQDGIYRNDQLGLIYHLPVGVKQLYNFAPDEKLVKKGKLPPTKYLSLSTYDRRGGPLTKGGGYGETKQYGDSNYIRRFVRIMAYYDQYYANPEDAIAYLRKQGKNAKGAADRVLRDSVECTFNGHKFYRSDFLRLSSNTIYWSEAPGIYVWFATVWRGYLLVINYWTDDTAGLDKGGMASLMHSMETIQLFDPNSPEPPGTTPGHESGYPPS